MADEKNNVEKQKDPKAPATGKDDKKAEKVNKEPEKAGKNEKTEKTAEPQKVGIVVRLLPWIIMGTVAAVCAGGGFGLGRLFAGPKTKTAAKSEQPPKEEKKEETKAEKTTPEAKKIWYFDLDPIVANLNEPGVTRYVRAAITLEIDQEMEKEKGTAFFAEKKPHLINWLNIFFASLTIEDIRGDKNQRRIQSQILDTLNEKLFPDAKPLIKEVLFKEFAIQ